MATSFPQGPPVLPRGSPHDDLSDPADASARVIRPAVVTPEQERFLEMLDTVDYIGLLHAIGEVERQKAVEYRNSRIAEGLDWKTRALHLVAQVDRRVLRSLIDGTLPQRALEDLRWAVRTPGTNDRFWQGRDDPVIYVNMIADKSGEGLSCDDFEMFLGAYEVAAKLAQDPSGKYSRKGVSVVDGVRTAYMRKRPVGARIEDFYAKVDHKDSLRTVVRNFVDVHRNTVLPLARANGTDHVMFRGEVGWSGKGYERCEAHRKLDPDGSPAGFRLAQCVLLHLFPERGFNLHQFVLFEIAHEEEAGIGESIGSQLCASYTTYGGFNIEQAGISDDQAWSMSAEGWSNVRLNFVDCKYGRHLDGNLDLARKLYTRQLQEYRDEITLHDIDAELKVAEAEQERQLSLLRVRLDMVEIRMKHVNDLLRDLRGEISRLDEKARNEEIARQAMRQLAVDLGVSIPSSLPTPQPPTR